MEDLNNNKITEKVLGDIKEGKVVMRSKAFFWIKYFLTATVAAFVTVLAIFLMVFVFYVLKIGGYFNVLQFGPRGWLDLLLSLPFVLLALTLLFMAGAILCLRHFSNWYRRSLLYLTITLLILLTLIASLLVYATPIRRSIYMTIEGVEIPIVSPIYDYYRNINPRNVIHGTVLVANEKEILVFCERCPVKEDLKIVLGPQTFLYSGSDKIEAGDYVVVYGQIKEGVVESGAVELVLKRGGE